MRSKRDLSRLRGDTIEPEFGPVRNGAKCGNQPRRWWGDDSGAWRHRNAPRCPRTGTKLLVVMKKPFQTVARRVRQLKNPGPVVKAVRYQVGQACQMEARDRSEEEASIFCGAASVLVRQMC